MDINNKVMNINNSIWDSFLKNILANWIFHFRGCPEFPDIIKGSDLNSLLIY